MKRWKLLLLSASGLGLFLATCLYAVYARRRKQRNAKKDLQTKFKSLIGEGHNNLRPVNVNVAPANNSLQPSSPASHGNNLQGSTQGPASSPSISSFCSSGTPSNISIPDPGISEADSESSVDNSRTTGVAHTPAVFDHILSDEEFQNCLASPIVQELLHINDIRMQYGRVTLSETGSVNSSVVQDFDEISRQNRSIHSVVDDSFHNIYDTYHNIVPALMPNTGTVNVGNEVTSTSPVQVTN